MGAYCDVIKMVVTWLDRSVSFSEMLGFVPDSVNVLKS